MKVHSRMGTGLPTNQDLMLPIIYTGIGMHSCIPKKSGILPAKGAKNPMQSGDMLKEEENSGTILNLFRLTPPPPPPHLVFVCNF